MAGIVRRLAVMVVLAMGAAVLFAGCSINRLAVRVVANALSGGTGAGAFGTDDDPELVGAALPFALKLYESLLEMDPNNPKLLLSTGTAFVMYAYAFVQNPAQMLPEDQIDRQMREFARATRLFLRGRDYVLRALRIKYPGKFQTFLDSRESSATGLLEMLSFASRRDIDYFYWAGAGWMGAVSAAGFDMKLIVSVPKAIALVRKVLAWDEGYGAGAAHDLMVSYYGAGLDPDPNWKERAREHYERALELSQGKNAGIHISYAMAVCVAEQDVKGFKQLLHKALAVNVDEQPELRLQNVIAQRWARWLLDHLDDYFLLPEGEEQ